MKRLHSLPLMLAISLLASCSTPKASISYERVALQESPAVATTPGLNQSMLNEMHTRIQTQAEYKHAFSMLMVKDGVLVSEAYFNGYKPDQRQNVKSVTKSILSLLVGIAQDRGHLRNVDQTMGELFPEHLAAQQDTLKPTITLHHALTMQTGLKWYENMEWLFNVSWDPNWMFRSKNTVQYVLGLDMEDVPGGHFHYSTGSSQLVAGALQRTTGKSPLEFAREHLFTPMGLEQVGWK
ncbi:MAG: beta-lactamase family protein, partial [Hymenobacteraceae bacterium]|nr:beta-lactamase family protein [Hymenobacteraceae bacterium]